MTARVLKAALAATAGGLLAMFALAASAQTPPTGPAATFETRCKACHDPAVERAPSRAELARRNPAVVVEALTTGAMAPMAQGLSAEQINDLASYLTGARARGPAPATQPADIACSSHAPLRAGPSDWVGYGADAAATRFQPRPRLAAADVPKLKVKWAFSLSGGRYGQPTVIGDRVFVTTATGHAFALDAASGCVHWRANLGAGSRTSPMVVKLKRGWVAVVGDVARDVHALDAETGRELWNVSVDEHPRGRITGSIAYHDGVFYVPVSSAEETIATVPDYSCCTFTGSVVALDAATGRRLWKTPLVEPAKPTRKNSAGTQMFGPAGAAIWSQPSIDVKRGRLYVATGDSYTEVEAPRSDAVVALALKDGKVVWENQVTPNDNFLTACGAQRRGLNCPLGEIGPDYDFGASPILARVPGGGQVLLSGQKSGVAYGMDPATGKRLWATKVGAGSAIGGIEWGMAYDGRALFASVSDAGARQDPKPGVYAIDPLTGRVLWSAAAPRVGCSFKTPRCSNAYAAPPTAIPGVVFTGSHDGWLRAYDSASGKLLFGFDTAGQTYATSNGVKDQPGGSIDATGPVVAGGRLFVISGYSGASGGFGNPLNVLLAFEPAR